MATAKNVDPSERIVITHKDTKGQGVCTRRQLETVWGPKGWTEVKDADPDKVLTENLTQAEAEGAASAARAAGDTTGA